LINDIVLPIAEAPQGLLLCPLFVIDKNDDDGNDNRVPSMILAVEDIVGAPSKFPDVPSADAEGRGTTTAATAQTSCDDDDDRFYATICHNPQLTSFSAYLCLRRLQQSTTKEQCRSRQMGREDGVKADDDDAADNASRSG